MSNGSTRPKDGGRLPVHFRIRVQTVDLEPEQVVWNPIRQALLAQIVQAVLKCSWNRLGPRALMELKRVVAPRVEGDTWAALFAPEVVDRMPLWQEIRTGLISSVTCYCDRCFQQQMWPHLNLMIANAFTGHSATVVESDSWIDLPLAIQLQVSPSVVTIGSREVRWDRPCSVAFEVSLPRREPLQIPLCLGGE